MIDAHSAESSEKSIQSIIKEKSFIFQVMSDFIYNLRVTQRDFQACHQPKKSFKSGQIYRKDAQ